LIASYKGDRAMHDIEMWLARQRVAEARAQLAEDRRARSARRASGPRTLTERLRWQR
jgi:hypothetical protein